MPPIFLNFSATVFPLNPLVNPLTAPVNVVPIAPSPAPEVIPAASPVAAPTPSPIPPPIILLTVLTKLLFCPAIFVPITLSINSGITLASLKQATIKIAIIKNLVIPVPRLFVPKNSSIFSKNINIKHTVSNVVNILINNSIKVETSVLT